VVAAAFLATRALAIGATHLGAAHMTPAKAAQWTWVENSDLLHLGPPPPRLLQPLQRWDSNFYIALAKDGYPPPGPGPNHHLAFFPLYGLLVRLVSLVVGNVFWAAFLLSNLCALIAALLVVELGKLSRPSDGLRAAVLFLASPGAHFFSYPYTEALFAALLAAALLSLRSQRFLLAALPGAAASATRSPGVAAAVALLAQAWESRSGRALAASALSLGGLVAFMIWCQIAQGDAFAFLRMQALHNRHLSLLGPVKAFLAFDTDPDYYVVTIAALYVAARMVRRTPAWAWVTAAFLLLLPLFTGTLNAMIRYVAADVPLLCGVPLLVRGRRFWCVLIACAALMAFEAFLFGKGIGHY